MNNITAIVKWFDNSKGIGFAKPFTKGVVNNDHEDIFLHHSDIEKKKVKGNNFVVMHKGELIQCSIVNSEKGLKAIDIIPIKNQLEGGEIN